MKRVTALKTLSELKIVAIANMVAFPTVIMIRTITAMTARNMGTNSIEESSTARAKEKSHTTGTNSVDFTYKLGCYIITPPFCAFI